MPGRVLLLTSAEDPLREALPVLTADPMARCVQASAHGSVGENLFGRLSLVARQVRCRKYDECDADEKQECHAWAAA